MRVPPSSGTCFYVTEVKRHDNPLINSPSLPVPSSRGLGHHPLKVETRVRTPLGLRQGKPWSNAVSGRAGARHGRLPPEPKAIPRGYLRNIGRIIGSPMVDVDVVVIGGGLQGLLVLDALAQSGRSCVLVSPTDAGTGQTLHSHGVLNTGFGMAGPGPAQLLQQVVVPDLRRRGIPTYGEWYGVMPPGMPVD